MELIAVYTTVAIARVHEPYAQWVVEGSSGDRIDRLGSKPTPS